MAAIERDQAGKAVRAANKSVGDAMKSASSEIDALANEARAMMDARSELEDKNQTTPPPKASTGEIDSCPFLIVMVKYGRNTF